MKKKKLKLNFKKDVISNLQAKTIFGGYISDPCQNTHTCTNDAKCFTNYTCPPPTGSCDNSCFCTVVC